MGAVVVGETRQITSFSVERRKAATEGIMRERGRERREGEGEGGEEEWIAPAVDPGSARMTG